MKSCIYHSRSFLSAQTAPEYIVDVYSRTDLLLARQSVESTYIHISLCSELDLCWGVCIVVLIEEGLEHKTYPFKVYRATREKLTMKPLKEQKALQIYKVVFVNGEECYPQATDKTDAERTARMIQSAQDRSVGNVRVIYCEPY